ncbi:hypothetical protein C7974DRAFT_376304 [Boeremia exigua]|uniref:uncharacterized protein n=1 Tax=Boeremia exigua TaxID=749465 RepID=UPI001E8EAB5E|nr:uncharacterized protein C7974DRAFT_376304 [Boeremia exigua]KAH6629466.1 hypothetical protein C7974DRAFT_376304 [Boeremia exigua]
MSSRVVHTLIEPSIVTTPASRSVVLSISRMATTLESLASTTTTLATATTVTDSSASMSTITVIPPLPTNFDSPLATGKDPTPAITVAVLVAAIICALILLVALLYFVLLRCLGKCSNCSHNEDQLRKWKNGDLKVITPEMVQQRKHPWDLEQGPMDLQARMYRDRMRIKSLARLEGQDEESLTDRASSVGYPDGESKDADSVKDLAHPQEAIPAHVIAAVARFEGDADATLINPEFPKTHSKYIKDVIAPREAEIKRSLQEAKEQAIDRYLHTASDPSNRESVQQRAVNKANEIIAEQEQNNQTEQMPYARTDGESRFKERFSLATNHDQW